MCAGVRLVALLLGFAGLAARSRSPSRPSPAPTQRPRPGLTAQQTKQAVELARGAMQELRKKTEGATEPEADRREYVVNVELLERQGRRGRRQEGPARRSPPPTPKRSAGRPPDPRAVVTSYRYFDDITVFSTIDLSTGKVVEVQAAQHIPTPLSDGEYEEAIDLARERSDEVKRLYERFGDQLTVYPQFSQFTVKDDPAAPSRRPPELPRRQARPELSPAAGRPDDARGGRPGPRGRAEGPAPRRRSGTN